MGQKIYTDINKRKKYLKNFKIQKIGNKILKICNQTVQTVR